MTVDQLSRGLKNEVSIQPQLVNQMGFLSKGVNFANRIEQVLKVPEPAPFELELELELGMPLAAYPASGGERVVGELAEFDHLNEQLILRDRFNFQLIRVAPADHTFFIVLDPLHNNDTNIPSTNFSEPELRDAIELKDFVYANIPPAMRPYVTI